MSLKMISYRRPEFSYYINYILYFEYTIHVDFNKKAFDRCCRKSPYFRHVYFPSRIAPIYETILSYLVILDESRNISKWGIFCSKIGNQESDPHYFHSSFLMCEKQQFVSRQHFAKMSKIVQVSTPGSPNFFLQLGCLVSLMHFWIA